MQPIPSTSVHTSHHHVPSAQGTTAAAIVIGAQQQEQLDQETKAASIETETGSTDTIPYLTEPDTTATPETAQQLMQELLAGYGLTDLPQPTDELDPALDPFYGMSQVSDSTMAMFVNLMAAVLAMLRASTELKNKSVENFVKANENMASEQRKEGMADFWGGLAAGVAGSTIGALGALRTVHGVGIEIGVNRDQALLNAAQNNPLVPPRTQLQLDTALTTGKSHQAWGEFASRGLGQHVGGGVSGAAMLDKAGHTKKATESNAVGTVANLTSDQQSQEVHSAAAIVAKILDQLAQYAATQKQTFSGIASNARPV